MWDGDSVFRRLSGEGTVFFYIKPRNARLFPTDAAQQYKQAA
jgi:hypothetical protein